MKVTATSSKNFINPEIRKIKEIATHYIGEFSGCDTEKLKHANEVEEVFTESIKISGAKIVGSKFHQFKPFGATGVLLLEESHASIHTWYEHNYAAVDFLSCDPKLDIEKALKHIQKKLNSSLEVKSFSRGFKDCSYKDKGLLIE